MSYASDDHLGMDFVQFPDLFTDLSESEQESVSGGMFLYFNQQQITSSAQSANSFTGTLGNGDGGGMGTGTNGTFTGSGSANYSLTNTTFILSVSDQMFLAMLPSLLNFFANV
jgi:hypothetical protein